ncbi:MAG: YicC family protein [Planctomycetales bacterium]|nr:YicC family protein [Planctomycetales bacterium]
MLFSMTGHGGASATFGPVTISVDLRTINSRYLKVMVRTSEGYSSLEPKIEEFVRQLLRRGTVQVQVQIDRQRSGDDYHINGPVLDGYRAQLAKLNLEASIDTLLTLPGVVADTASVVGSEEVLKQILEVVQAAVENLQAMRGREGANMAADLHENAQVIAVELAAISERVPQVAESYGNRLVERINSLLEQHGVQVEPSNVVREVGLFAERTDISEELVRLDSHLSQFGKFVDSEDTNGRKLDFLVQEMYRETNTIGSKANDFEIATRVVQIKSCIERMREMIQNIE